MSDAETQRREAIRQVLRTKRVGTQEELREELATRGFVVTQATLSRDLTRLRARRVTLPNVGSVYELEAFQAADVPDEISRVRDLVMAVEDSAALVVLLTLAGAAPAVALALDRARLDEVLATLAGDDTVLVVPAKKTSTATLAKRLRKLWKKEGHS